VEDDESAVERNTFLCAKARADGIVAIMKNTARHVRDGAWCAWGSGFSAATLCSAA
jgi:hypothetical protein